MKSIALLFFLMIGASSLYAQADKQQEVVDRMLQLKNGLTGRDSIALTDVLDDELTYGHSTGITQTKKELIRDIVSGVQTYNKIGPTDMVIRIYHNTAVVTIKARVSMLWQEKPLELSMNVLLIWAKKKGIWKLVARQAVKNNQ